MCEHLHGFKMIGFTYLKDKQTKKTLHFLNKIWLKLKQNNNINLTGIYSGTKTYLVSQ